MIETRPSCAPRRIAFLLAAALTIGGPATGQGPMPPVPGPFPVNPVAGFGMQIPMPSSPGGPERADRSVRPAFQPPVNAMRLPYWMQTPVAPMAPVAAAPGTADALAPAEAAAPAPGMPAPTRTVASAPARTAPQAPAANGYGQPVPFWAGPAYIAPGYSPQGYAAQGYRPQGYGTQGYGAQAPWPQLPGWGYATAPGWAPAPSAPAPGWGNGWGNGWGAPAAGVGP